MLYNFVKSFTYLNAFKIKTTKERKVKPKGTKEKEIKKMI